MRVLGLSGSPRRDGNTDNAVKIVLETLRDMGAETLFLRVGDFRIEPCRGCRDCMKTGECSIKDDDFQKLLDEVMKSDLLILGAPVYWFAPPGVMKNFIDRTHGFYLDKSRLKGKMFAIISVAADSGFETHERIMSWLRVYGATLIAKVRVYAREKGDLERRPREVRKLKRFAEEVAVKAGLKNAV